LILIEKVLGNASDPEWAARLAAGTVESLALDHWEAQKNRFRKKTANGQEVAVSLDRGAFLRDGDVLLWDAAGARGVVARISLRDVMIIHLDELAPDYGAERRRTRIIKYRGQKYRGGFHDFVIQSGGVRVPLTRMSRHIRSTTSRSRAVVIA